MPFSQYFQLCVRSAEDVQNNEDKESSLLVLLTNGFVVQF